MAPAGRGLRRARPARPGPAADRRQCPAPARSHLPDYRLVPRRHHAGVDRLRLQPAVQQLVQHPRRPAAGPRRRRGDDRPAHRSPRTGRDGVEARTRAALPAGDRRRCLPAQGVDPRALLQRAAGDGQADPRRPGQSRLPGLRGPGDRQQHQGPGGLGAGAGPLRHPRPALPLLPRRTAGRLQGRRTELRVAAHRRRR
ncbi:hypothetical protein D3C81_1431370 [compost metagenome]